MKTAEEFRKSLLKERGRISECEFMIEFAKLHVEAALKSAVYYAETTHRDFGVKEESILNAYPL